MKTLAFFFVLALAAFGGETITVNGREYLNATLSKSDELTVKISHESGIARAPFSQFSKEIQTKLGYDPAKAALLSLSLEARARSNRQAQATAALIQKSPIVKLTVSTVLSDGLIGEATIYSPDGKYLSRRDIFLCTETESADYVDGSTYKFDAFQSGTFQFTTVLGATRTVSKFVDARLPASRQSSSK